MPDIGLILLAAGGSTRMGRPKQLLVYQGKTLLRRAAETAVASGCRPVVVVLGNEPDAMRAELVGLDVTITLNDRWQVGMGASIRRGMAEMPESLDGVVVMLCDQPFVTAKLIHRLMDAFHHSAESVCASTYDGTFGPPCLFGASNFHSLRSMPEEQGAKKLIATAPDIKHVPFDRGGIDIDTPEDFEKLL